MTQVIVSSRILEMDNEMASSDSFTGRLRDENQAAQALAVR